MDSLEIHGRRRIDIGRPTNLAELSCTVKVCVPASANGSSDINEGSESGDAGAKSEWDTAPPERHFKPVRNLDYLPLHSRASEHPDIDMSPDIRNAGQISQGQLEGKAVVLSGIHHPVGEAYDSELDHLMETSPEPSYSEEAMDCMTSFCGCNSWTMTSPEDVRIETACMCKAETSSVQCSWDPGQLSYKHILK